jgi:hypothetical protein
MPNTPPNPELLRSLGRLVRGLSALFWGLPLALIVCVETAKTSWLQALTIFPPAVATGLLFYGLSQLTSFQTQERPWRTTLDYARLFALITFGLSPFLYWWNRVPEQPLFGASIYVFAMSAWLLLFSINLVVQRLGAMLPDETLRHETRQFTSVNRSLLIALLLLVAIYIGLMFVPVLPESVKNFLVWVDRVGSWLLVFLILLPLAMTMALIWKAKEVVLDSVFGGNH